MAKKKSSLGRGFDTLFLDNTIEQEESERSKTLRLSKIEPNPDQPRREFDLELLTELADSIAKNGVIQPIAVRPAQNEGYFTIIAGERRWRAAKMAGLSEIPVIILDIDDKKAAELALIENIQRKDLNPIEEARAYKALIDEYDMTQADLAATVGKSRVSITNFLRLLDLPDEILHLVSDESISTGHARALLGLKNPDDLLPLAKRIADESLSVRATEEAVRRLNSKKSQEVKSPSAEKLQLREYYKAIENKATAHIGSRVKISDSSRSKSISIAFSSTEELEDILIKLCTTAIFDDIK
ncbi:MAG: ParB/RepB/Spo0J family partition protein [Ruminococcaceae bacterium]|nr:ParB/RepB/Spo0J family partition protein [Oscillospiraceae bacterium]